MNLVRWIIVSIFVVSIIIYNENSKVHLKYSPSGDAFSLAVNSAIVIDDRPSPIGLFFVMKKCTKCLQEKLIDEFGKSSRNKTDGRLPVCKICQNKQSKKYRENNSEKFKATIRRYYYKNHDKMKAEKAKYTAKSKDKKSSYDVSYRQQNKEKIAKYKKEWEAKKKNEPLFRIKLNLRRRIHHLLRDGYKSKSTIELIGCSFEEFKSHIEKQFTEGMSWENYGDWHIDHIMPCFTFDLSKLEQQYACFHYSNQRPLWKIDNLKRPRNIYKK